MRKNLYTVLFTVSFLVTTLVARAQCVEFINYPADTVGWVRGSSEPSNGVAQFIEDTMVVVSSHNSENNYFYNTLPVTLAGAASVFSASFDFRMDSSSGCSDGLTFWFFTSSLDKLGSRSYEGGSLGFQDTVSGFALALKTTVCLDDIYMMQLNSTTFGCCSGVSTAGDTLISAELTFQTWLTDGNWHHCNINYAGGTMTASFDGGKVVMSGTANIFGTGFFGFMGTNGAGYTRKSLKNVQICADYGTPTAGNDSFSCYVIRQCNGPQITSLTGSYNAANYILTYWGDGTHDSSRTSTSPDGGYAVISHSYNAPGHYSISQKLYNAGLAKDSLQMSFENVFCTTLPLKFYFDANGDCLLDNVETYISLPVLVEVDSNSIVVDTISVFSGLYYNANGNIGDVYTFRVLSVPGNMHVSCPADGILNYTLTAGVFINPVQFIAVYCDTGSGFDLSVTASIPVTGTHDEWGDVYVANAWCAPVDATLTVNYSPKYVFTGDAYPSPISTSGTTITWNISSLSNDISAPAHIHYQVDCPASAPLTAGDTVNTYYTVFPVAGDADTGNNHCHIVDTVKDGCDPNEMTVQPSGIIPPTVVTPLQYTINFTNTGNDTAYNIYIMDTLSTNVEVGSLRLVMASSTMNIVMLQSGGQNIVKFDFPAINLQDSAANPNHCSGAVIFNINTISGLPLGANVFNHVGVFFDENPVVMTDTVEDIVGIPTRVPEPNPAKGGVAIYPNPTTDHLIIKTDGTNYSNYTIANTLGVTLLQQAITSAVTTVDIKVLPAGMYFVYLTPNLSTGGEGEQVVRKVVKE